MKRKLQSEGKETIFRHRLRMRPQQSGDLLNNFIRQIALHREAAQRFESFPAPLAAEFHQFLHPRFTHRRVGRRKLEHAEKHRSFGHALSGETWSLRLG